ncbi:uncharacterized protein N7459_002846 [Penicillium hispanicum]|uniref:uncharacterized protein n=1 Tax=Penicillium hispanicum TaxID=1080232 RepID=UPI0025416221|nr:uncharacterized protein N7459_002846 [Penicillium hispanicum]KAJ5587081.1 hypothetical protein N7459_002846 [Penicillium hispanicum]
MARPKVSKTKAPSQGSKRKPKTAPSAENMRFLWQCFHSTEGNKVDYNKLSKDLGVPKKTLLHRFWRLKNYFEDLEARHTDGEQVCKGQIKEPKKENGELDTVKKEKVEIKDEIKEEIKEDIDWQMADGEDEA